MPLVNIGQTRVAGGGVILKPKAILHDPLTTAGLTSPYTQAAANAVTLYGSNWQWLPYDNLYDQDGYVSLTQRVITNLTKSITDANAKKFFFGRLLPGRYKATDVFTALNGIQIHVASNVYALSGLQQPVHGDPLSTPGALIGALVTGRLSVSPQGAAEIIAYSRRTGSGVSLSAWQTWGQLALTAATIVGASYAAGEMGSGSAASTGVAPTTVSTTVPTTAVTAPAVPLSTASIPAAGIPALSAASVAAPVATAASAGGSLLTGAATGAGVIAKAAGALTAVGGVVAAVKASNAAPIGTPATTGLPAAPSAVSSLKKWLVPAAALAAWFAFS